MFYRTMALLTRSFHIDARSAQSHFSRWLFAGMIVASLAFVQLQSMVFGAPGLRVFSSISWLNVFFITLAGIGLFATAISEEKEEETLGLLRMAGISPVSLLLGKSTTRLVSVLLMLVVQFPFVLLSITLGGVLLEQVLSSYLSLIAYLVFLANLGLLCSVIGSSSRRAATLMTLALCVVLVVLPIVAFVVNFHWGSRPAESLNVFQRGLRLLLNWSESISIWNRISESLSATFRETLLSAQVIVHFLAALVLFGLSWALFERCTREKHTISLVEKVLTGPIGLRRDYRIGRTWKLALTWKDFYFVAGGMTSMFLRLILYVIIIGALGGLQWYFDPQPLIGLPKVIGVIAMFSMVLAAAIELALFASRVFREEVAAQTLSLLAMLPGTTTKLVGLKALAAIPAIVPSFSCFIVGTLLDPEDFLYGLHNVLTNSFGWCVLIWFVLFLHVTTYLSLMVKWGSLPLAIFLMYCAITVMATGTALIWTLWVGSRFGTIEPIWEFLPSIMVGAAGVIAFHVGILKRLRTLAAR